MADLADVETALVSLIAAALYPNGIGQPSTVATQTTLTNSPAAGDTLVTLGTTAGLYPGVALNFYGGTFETQPVASINGSNVVLAAPLANAHTSASTVTYFDACRVYRGWPMQANLDADLRLAIANVSVYALKSEKNTTRYPRIAQQITALVHTLTATASPTLPQVTIGGTVSTPQSVIVLCSGGNYFAYGVLPGDTLNSIAASLAAQIAVVFPGTTSTGPTITIAGHPGTVIARIAAAVQTWTEEKRQENAFQITTWCATPALRDTVSAAVDLALSQLDFITMPDVGGSSARLRYEYTHHIDNPEKELLYRRDVCYTVEYATSLIGTAYEIGTVSILANVGQPVIPAYQLVGIARGFGNTGFPAGPQFPIPPPATIITKIAT